MGSGQEWAADEERKERAQREVAKALRQQEWRAYLRDHAEQLLDALSCNTHEEPCPRAFLHLYEDLYNEFRQGEAVRKSLAESGEKPVSANWTCSCGYIANGPRCKKCGAQCGAQCGARFI